MRGKLPHIHERFLRHIWSRQYLNSSSLCTTDRTPVRVISAGELNDEEGPDFLDARIRIGPTTFRGDVEIHRNVADWLHHQHHHDPRYNRVILHVVLESGQDMPPTVSVSGRIIPTLVLEPFLPESVHSVWKKTVLDEQARRQFKIKCFEVNRSVEPHLLQSWLTKLARERLELKVRRFDERLRQLAVEHQMCLREPWRSWLGPFREGYPHEIPPPLDALSDRDLMSRELWDQVLYEGIMEGLGYSKNREPFLRLARSLTLARIRSVTPSADPLTVQALLFGVSGLLPKTSSLEERQSRDYVRSLRRIWRGARDAVRVERIHVADWRFFPTRPANFPTVRLSAACALVERLVVGDLFRAVIQAMKRPGPPADNYDALQQALCVEAPGFWTFHYSFDRRSARPVTALGSSRVSEIMMNTILPIGLLYARTFSDQSVREGVLALHDWLPQSARNAITVAIEQQLLGKKVKLDTMRLQQGAIQLYTYYCIEERCAECEVGKRVFSAEVSA